MKKLEQKLRVPHHGNDMQLIREGGGARWQARDGMVIRVAAPEPGREQHPDVVDQAAPEWPLLLKSAR